MKLTVVERFQLLNILPAESNFVTLKIVRDLQNNLSLDEEENEKIGATTVGMQVTWNVEKCKAYDKTPKEVQIIGTAHSIIVEAMTKLDQQKKLPIQLFDLYDRFVNGVELAEPVIKSEKK